MVVPRKLDSAARRVYVSHDTHVVVLDADSGAVVGDIPNTLGVHGIALAGDLGRGFISAGRANTIIIFDLKTLKVTSEVKATGVDTDSLIYDPAGKRVFVNNGDGKNTTVVDAAKGTVAGTIALDGGPEAAVADGKGSVFMNIADKGQMLEYDTKTLAIKNRWPADPCKRPVGLSMDRAHRRLFMACQGANNIMAVMNADNGKVVTTMPIGIGADGAAYDPAGGVVFVTSRDGGDGKNGVTKVFHEDSPDKYTLVADVKTIYGARPLSLDPKTHHVFLIGTEKNDPVPPTAKQPHPRPKPDPATFEVVEIGK